MAQLCVLDTLSSCAPAHTCVLLLPLLEGTPPPLGGPALRSLCALQFRLSQSLFMKFSVPQLRPPHTQTHVRVHICSHTYIYAHTNTQMRSYAYMHVHTCTQIHICKHIHSYARTCAHTYTCTDILTGTHTHTHTHIVNICSPSISPLLNLLCPIWSY